MYSLIIYSNQSLYYFRPSCCLSQQFTILNIYLTTPCSSTLYPHAIVPWRQTETSDCNTLLFWQNSFASSTCIYIFSCSFICWPSHSYFSEEFFIKCLIIISLLPSTAQRRPPPTYAVIAPLPIISYKSMSRKKSSRRHSILTKNFLCYKVRYPNSQII